MATKNITPATKLIVTFSVALSLQLCQIFCIFILVSSLFWRFVQEAFWFGKLEKMYSVQVGV